VKKPSFLTGLLWGALFTIALLAVFFAGYSVAALSFPPFEVFDWMARVLPGDVITFGIDTMVILITAFGLPTSETAKVAEQIMGIGLTIGIGAVAAMIFFFVMNVTQKKRNEFVPGLTLGLSLAIPFILFGLAVPSSLTATEPIRGIIWIGGAFVLWGLALSYLWNNLTFASVSATDKTVSAEALDRRSFLVRVGAGTATIFVVGAGVGALMRRTTTEAVNTLPAASVDPSATQAVVNAEPLPNAGDPVVAAPGTRPEITPIDNHYRIDINSVPPTVEEVGYVLPILNAMNGNELVAEMTLDEIRSMPATDAYITMSCISNRLGGDLISTTRWTGVSMQYFLEQVGVPEGATHLRITSADGFDEVVALDIIAEDERVMLAYAWDGEPLRQRHGFPLRIHIPNRFGMKQPKWITQMEFLNADQDGYWVRRGWSKDALVRATSVIDTVAVNDHMEIDGRTLIPVGGIAWASVRGISRVEVRVDSGEWQEAQLRSPVSDRTWTIWRYDWEFSEGSHQFEVRCQEGDGTPQVEAVNPVRPDGATGIDTYLT